MSEPKDVQFTLSCVGCLVVILLAAAGLGAAYGLMIGMAYWVGGLFA